MHRLLMIAVVGWLPVHIKIPNIKIIVREKRSSLVCLVDGDDLPFNLSNVRVNEDGRGKGGEVIAA